MKTLHLLIIVIVTLVTIGIITMTFLTLQSNIAKQNQAEKLQARIHVLTDNGTKYVKISDLASNSAVRFSYPYTGTIFDQDANHSWELVRLPKDMGGDKDDISSFRAYSMIDIDSGCMALYRLSLEKIQDECNYNEYEPVNGVAVVGRAMYHKYSALPNLDLGVDDEGYIYAKQPTFELDKNGVIGLGRKVQ